MTRWQQFYLNDSDLGSILPSSYADQAAEIFAKNNSKIILDLGCGAGRDSFYLADGEAQVAGLDAARSGLLLGQKCSAAARLCPFWVESDSRFLPFSDALFDAAYCFGLLREFVGKSALAHAPLVARL